MVHFSGFARKMNHLPFSHEQSEQKWIVILGNSPKRKNRKLCQSTTCDFRPKALF
ncbi:MAG: hypothetical protein U5L45_05255 [Saprospiraceae bacterium]|nr:hypothetical protein [Saprospiraceae bacterium]